MQPICVRSVVPSSALLFADDWHAIRILQLYLLFIVVRLLEHFVFRVPLVNLFPVDRKMPRRKAHISSARSMPFNDLSLYGDVRTCRALLIDWAKSEETGKPCVLYVFVIYTGCGDLVTAIYTFLCNKIFGLMLVVQGS